MYATDAAAQDLAKQILKESIEATQNIKGSVELGEFYDLS